MPLGASRLSFLAKTQVAAVVEQRTAKRITAFSTAQIDTAQSKFGGSSYLNNGSSDYLEIDNMTSPGTGDFTVEFWFRSTVDGSLNDGLFHWSATGFSQVGGVNGRGLALALRSTSQFGIYYGDNTTTIGGSFSANTWYHAAVVRSSGTLTVYINGSSIWSASDTQNYDGIGKIAIGAYYNATFGINGNIDEFRVSTTARYTSGFTAPTAPFVNDANTQLLIHADGTDGDTVFIDDNGERAPVGVAAINDAQISTAQSKFGNSSFVFDGTDDYLSMPNGGSGGDFDLGSNDFTIEAWVRPDSVTGTRSFVTLWSDDWNTDDRIWWFGQSNANVVFYYYTGNNNTVKTNVATTTSPLSINTWSHVAVTGDSSNFKIYVDGSLLETETRETIDPLGGTGAMTIGATSGAAFDYDGYIDEVRISDNIRYTTGFTPSTSAFTNDANTLLLLHAEEGANGTTEIFDDNGYTLPPPPTQLWSDYDATNNGSDVVVHNDTAAGDGNSRHRVNMFNDTYGVISYNKDDDSTNTYWKQITLSDTSITLGSENSYASAITTSHVTTQIGINAATNKIVQGHMVDDGDGNLDLKYVVFTLSGSSVSASSVKSLDGTSTNWHQHANVFELDFSNNRFVFEGQEGVSVIDFNTGTDTLSEVDYFDYTNDGTTDFTNVACAFKKIDSSNWLLVGSNGTNHVTQGYTISGSTISELSGTNTTVVAVSSTAVAMSRAAANAKSNSNASLIYPVGDSTNNTVVLYPIKATTSSVSVGSALTFNPTNSTSYGRVDNSVWINDSTYVGIYGFGDNNTILKPFSYDFSTNAITEYSPSVTETQVNTDGGYIFQARKADRVDAERIIVAWTESGVDTTGDLTVKVVKAGPTT